jgi:hypothetical protein
LANQFGDVVGGDEHFEGVIIPFAILVVVELDDVDEHD